MDDGRVETGIIEIPREMWLCILPFAKCPYHVTKLGVCTRILCEEIANAPGNSDAACFQIKNQRTMIFGSKMTPPQTFKD